MQSSLVLANLREETLLAYNMNGKPLTDEHGFPLRVIVPFKYGYKNPKAILKMEYVSNMNITCLIKARQRDTMIT